VTLNRFLTGRHIDSLNAELNPICHLLALLGTRHILHVSGLRVNHLASSNYLSQVDVYLSAVINFLL